MVRWMQYRPHDYQAYATDFVLTHPYCGLILDMGLGKSVITLTALWELLLDSFDIARVLVIAPKRVAEDTWPTEIAKWDHLKGLTCSLCWVRKNSGGRHWAKRRCCTSSTGRTWRGWWRIITGTSTRW